MASLVDYKNKNGTIYVYKNVSTWNKEKKKADTERICIGRRDPLTNEILYNKKYLAAHGMEKAPIQTSPLTQQCGPSLLLDKISMDTGLRQTLKETFPNNWGKILTLAYYFAMENKAVHHIDTWSTLNKTPYGKKITSQRVSDLCKALSQDLQMNFFNAWAKQNIDESYHALDITSVSSYSALNEMVKYGYNRDGENLPQVNMLMITSHTSKVPCYYEILPGSIRDVNTLNKVLEDLNWMNKKKIRLVMDKGFCSTSNIDMLYKHRYKFIIGMTFVSNFADNCVKRVQSNIMNVENYCNIHGNDLYATSFLEKWKGHRMYVHVYYDSAKADGEYREFSRKIKEQKEALETNKQQKSHETDYEKYFIVKETPVRGRKVSINKEAVETFRNSRAGYFILVSNDEKDPVKALEIYRDKDVVEKSFDNLKSSLDCSRMRTHSKETMSGRFFLQFLSLILMTAIQNKMQEKGLYKKYSYSTLINELKTLSVIKYPGKRKLTYTEMTKDVKAIFKNFEIDEKTYV